MRAIGFVAAIIVGTVLAACRQIVGIEDNPATELTSTVCGLSFGTTACASCANANCCSQATACAASSQICKPYETCLGACPQGDPACRARCGIAYPTGTTAEVSALSACLVTHCEDDCGLGCGALAGWAVEPDAAAGFQTCMAQHCDAVRACASSAGCDAVTRCFAACYTRDCVDTCMASNGVDPAFYFAGAAVTSADNTFAAFDQARTACSSTAGGYWECVGHVSWSAPQAPSAALQAIFIDVQSRTMGLPGLDVRACNTTDIDCTAPGWPVGQTDAFGRIALAVPLVGSGGYLKITSSGTMPAYWYWGFPISQSRFVVGFSGSGNLQRGIAIDTIAEYQSLKQQIAMTFDGGLTDTPLGVYVEDCLHTPAAGVRVTLSAGSQQAVPLTGLVPGAPLTDSSGFLLFVNVPTGPLMITATPVAVGRVAGKVSVTIRDGGPTTVVIGPTPQ